MGVYCTRKYLGAWRTTREKSVNSVWEEVKTYPGTVSYSPSRSVLG